MKVHKNRFACTMCPKEYKSRDSLQKHVENVHNNSNECPFTYTEVLSSKVYENI